MRCTNRIASGLAVGVAGFLWVGSAAASVCPVLVDGGIHVDVKNKNSQFAVWDTDSEHSQFYGDAGGTLRGSSFNRGNGAGKFKNFIASELTGDGETTTWGDIEVKVLDLDKVEIFLPGSQGTTDVILAVGDLVAHALVDATGLVDVKDKHSRFYLWDTDADSKMFHGAAGPGATAIDGSSMRIEDLKQIIADVLAGRDASTGYGQIEVTILANDTVGVTFPGSQGSADYFIAFGSALAAVLGDTAGLHVDVKNKNSQFAIWDTDNEHRQFYGGAGGTLKGSSFNRGRRGANKVKSFVDDIVSGVGETTSWGDIGLEVLGCGELLIYLPGSRGTLDTILVTGHLAEEAIIHANAEPGLY